MIEVRHLRLLVAVAEHHTLTRAAAALALSQSALSRQLLELEDDLGRPLFERRARSMVPTGAGRELTETAGRMLRELDLAWQRARASDDAPRPLSIATECYTLYRWLPRVLGQLARTSPRQRVVIDVNASRNPVDALVRGKIDLAIINAPRRDRRLVLEPAFDDEMMLITAPRHRLASLSHVTAADLAGEAIITYDAPFDETLFGRKVFGPARARPARVHPVPFTEAIVELVAAGLGVAIMAGWAAAPLVAAGRVATVRLTRAGLRRQWLLARRRDATPATVALAKQVRAAVLPDGARDRLP